MHLSAPALLTLTVSLLASACGGSSSETPPPLEPDPTSYRYTGPRPPSASEQPAPTLARESDFDEDDRPAAPNKPAAATWGSGKPTPAPSSEAAGK